MLVRLLLLFTLIPLIELAIMIKVGQYLGVMATILIILAAGLLGATLAKYEGLRTLRAVQEDLNAGRLPHDRLLDGLIILVAGVLLVTPGFLTDFVGLLLLVPPVRSLVRKYLKKRFAARFTIVDMSGRPPQDDFIDVEAHSADKNDQNQDSHRQAS